MPVAWHRYLVGPPERSGNPVLSIHGSDVIVFSSSLRSHLPNELGRVQGTPAVDHDPEVEPIPFWDDVIDGLPWDGPFV